jgi:hypothetical protein
VGCTLVSRGEVPGERKPVIRDKEYTNTNTNNNRNIDNISVRYRVASQTLGSQVRIQAGEVSCLHFLWSSFTLDGPICHPRSPTKFLKDSLFQNNFWIGTSHLLKCSATAKKASHWQVLTRRQHIKNTVEYTNTYRKVEWCPYARNEAQRVRMKWKKHVK